MTADFPHRALLLRWVDRMTASYPEEHEFLGSVADALRDRSTMALHLGALGMRVLVARELERGHTTAPFARRMDALLWSIEVLAAGADAGLPDAAVASVVEAALCAPDAALDTVAALVDAAERIRWHEWKDARERLTHLHARVAPEPGDDWAHAWNQAMMLLEKLVASSPRGTTQA